MANIRIAALAKELEISSEELMEHLLEEKIPFKTHSSTLVPAHVSKIRKKLKPELDARKAKAQAEAADAAKAEAAAAKQAEDIARIAASQEAERKAAEAKKAAEEQARNMAAVERERAQREKEKAEREAAEQAEAEEAARSAANKGKNAPKRNTDADDAEKPQKPFAGFAKDKVKSKPTIASKPTIKDSLREQLAKETERLAAEQARKSDKAATKGAPGGKSVPGGKAMAGGKQKRGGKGAHKPASVPAWAEALKGIDRSALSEFDPKAVAAAMAKHAAAEKAAAAAGGGPAGGGGAVSGKAVSAANEKKQGASAAASSGKGVAPGKHAGAGKAGAGVAKGTIAGAGTEAEITAGIGTEAIGAGAINAGTSGVLGDSSNASRLAAAAGTDTKTNAKAGAKAKPASDGKTNANAEGRFAGLKQALAAQIAAAQAAEAKNKQGGYAAEGATGTGAPLTKANALDSKAGKGKKGKQQADAFSDGRGIGDGDGDARRRGGAIGKAKSRGGKLRVDGKPEIVDVDDISEVNRYRDMARRAELMQRDRVIADARAAVAAAEGEGTGKRKGRKEKRIKEATEAAALKAIERGIDPELVLDASVVQITTGASVQEFADALGVASNDIVKRLFLLGTPLTVTQTMGDELIELIADDLNRKVRIVSPEEEYAITIADSPDDLLARPPVVTVMGHVDHGKTSLLDAIRETGVVQTEAGGITQHIGASVVHINERQITFIDTPGHEAFTAMRARGAAVTDVVVLVVAADDGVMPQTVEAIHHAKAAGVPIVVAVNKIDKPGATPERVRQELTEHGIIPEEWGGQNMFVDVSAKQRTGIDDLLEIILLQADVLELKANPNALASGFVIEAKLDKGRGPVATVLVQRGTLAVGNAVVVGTAYGRVRALVDPKGDIVEKALPSDPVELLGLGSVPAAGDEFRVFAEERDARSLAEDRALRARLAEQQKKSHVTLEDLFSRIEEEKLSQLNLVVKADVQGSIEALSDALVKMDQTEVRINVIHSAVGGITETDVTLAAASDAVIIGFNVRPSAKAKQAADRERVEIKTYRVIYQAIEEINAARVGLLSPEIIEEDTGMAEVREIFKVPKVGSIAGCFVQEGEINSSDNIRIVRDGTVILDGKIGSLRHYKEDVKNVKAGSECGISVENFQDIKPGDVIESYRSVEVARES
jgi:translation initiation factor IF-2